MPLTPKDDTRRIREVELRVLSEFALSIFIVAMFGAMFAENLATKFDGRFRFVLLVLAVALVWSFSRRWMTRAAKWHRMIEWAKEPVAFDGSAVVQVNESGRRTGAIDPREHYTVRWERFTSARALYSISQGEQVILVSTLAANARLILRDTLNITNYDPCEEWPNLDL